MDEYSIIKNIMTCDEARIPVTWLVTSEETRVEAELVKFTRSYGDQADIWAWSLTSNNGFPGWGRPYGWLPKTEEEEKKKAPFDPEVQGVPNLALYSILTEGRKSADSFENKVDGEVLNKESIPKMIIIFRDPHVFFQDAGFIRTLRDASRDLRDTFTTIVCISPVGTLPAELETDVEVIHPGLPSKEVIKELLKESFYQDFQGKFELPDIDDLASACCGLTLIQALDAISKSIVELRKVDLGFVHKVKTERISAVPGLTYIDEVVNMDDVGGLEGLKDWVEERREGFSQEARDFNLPFPKGVLCVGFPGAGKSLFAKAIAGYLNLPLIRFNPPDVKAGIVGATEANVRRVIQSLDAIGPHVCWIDELEKTMPKQGVRNIDGGTSDAILQSFLHWAQERKGGGFICGTCNDITSLPPELIRKGRWDAIFFVDLPNQVEREEVIRIHLRKRGRSFSNEEISAVAEALDSYSGAEIEGSIIDGIWKAFGDKKRDLRPSDVISCAKEDTPLSTIMKEELKALREWAGNRARPASKSIKEKSTKENKQRGNLLLRKMKNISNSN
jgi:ATP-dependent 26S proteasome regulatory subunit